MREPASFTDTAAGKPVRTDDQQEPNTELLNKLALGSSTTSFCRHSHSLSSFPSTFTTKNDKMGGERGLSKASTSKSTYPAHALKPVGKWISNLYTDRLEQLYAGGQYKEHNLQAYVLPSHYYQLVFLT